jgi:hypothetical protein
VSGPSFARQEADEAEAGSRPPNVGGDVGDAALRREYLAATRRLEEERLIFDEKSEKVSIISRIASEFYFMQGFRYRYCGFSSIRTRLLKICRENWKRLLIRRFLKRAVSRCIFWFNELSLVTIIFE